MIVVCVFVGVCINMVVGLIVINFLRVVWVCWNLYIVVSCVCFFGLCVVRWNLYWFCIVVMMGKYVFWVMLFKLMILIFNIDIFLILLLIFF